MNQTQVTARQFYDKIYSERLPAKLEWVAGTASPELIKLVWEGTLKSGMKVLEVGSGIGTEAVFLAIRGMEVTGIDLSVQAVELGKKLAGVYGVDIDFRQEDATSLSFKDDQFDVVCDQGVFHHLTNEERNRYAKSIHRVLKSNGLFILRCFSDKIPDGPHPRRIKSIELTTTFLPYFVLEHLERVLSFSTETRKNPIGWFTVWVNKS